MTAFDPDVVLEVCGRAPRAAIVMYSGGKLDEPEFHTHWEGETPMLFGYVRASMAFRLHPA